MQGDFNMYIGIDLGTTGCKTVMYGGDGRVLCEYNREYELIFRDGFVEQDANEWWRLVCEGLSYVVEKSGVCDVRGISVSTQSISFVPVDKNGRTLDNAVSWLDLRADEQCERLKEHFGEKYIYDVTGKFCLCDYSLPKLMWLKEHKPDIYFAADKILFPLDFLNFKLCGRAVCDYTVAGGSMAYDIHGRCWSRELLDFAGIDERKLPEVGCMGEKVGMLLPEVCKVCGISGRCAVYLGGQDQKLAALGAGIEKDVCTVSFGTATAISKLCENDGGASLFRFSNSEYISELALMTTGAALRWLSRTLYGSMSYKEMDALAENSAPGAGGVVFESDLSSGGAIRGLTLSTTSADIVYALYEGVSRDIAKAVESLGGADRLKVFGGGAKSDIWCRILARIANIPVEVLDTAETASLGAAMLASEYKIRPAGVKKILYPENN